MGQTLQILAITAVIFASAPLELGTRDQALTRLFTPIAVPRGTYVVYTSTETIEVLTARLRERDGSPAPGAWEPTRPEAHGAFGQEGAYDRARLARLFNGKRVTVVRGSFVDSGQRLAYTLVSPYPDATLSRIVSGTMVIEFRVPPLDARIAGRPGSAPLGTPALQHSSTPALRHFGTPALRHSSTPALQHFSSPAVIIPRAPSPGF